MLKFRCFAAVAAAAALFDLGGAAAQPVGGWTSSLGGLRHHAHGVMLNCGADVARLCPEVTPGGGRIVSCLRAQDADLSPRCADTLARAAAGKRAIFACYADAATYCGDVLPGGGRIARCLNDQLSQISPACRDALTRAQAAFGE